MESSAVASQFFGYLSDGEVSPFFLDINTPQFLDMPPYQPVIEKGRKNDLMKLMVQILHNTFDAVEFLYQNCLDYKLAKVMVYNQLKIHGDFEELDKWNDQKYAKCFVSAVRLAFPDTHAIGKGMDDGIDSREEKGTFIKKLILKPVAYIHTTFNMYPYGEKSFGHKEKPDPCVCKMSTTGTACTDRRCLNQYVQAECFGRGEMHKCGNQRIQQRQFLVDSLRICDAGTKGKGIKTSSNIPQGQFIAEYVGEVMTYEEYDARSRRIYQDREHFYSMHLDDDIMIDATMFGNITRYINHSCTPNCAVEKWFVGTRRHLIIVSLRNIDKGEDVTYDYKWTSKYHKMKCSCGATNCRKIIG